MEKHCPRQWLSLTQNCQRGTTMPRNEEELSRDEHIDQKVLVEYIKNDLFQKAKFVLGKDEWDVGGMIYKDYIKCCWGEIDLQTMTAMERRRAHGEDLDESANQEGTHTRDRTHPYFGVIQDIFVPDCTLRSLSL